MTFAENARGTRLSLGLAVFALAVALPLCGWTTDLSGVYSGQFEGQPARATLSVEGGTVSGTLDVDGYVYRIEGRQQGAVAKGRMIDQNGHAVQLTLQQPANDQLTMLIEAIPGVALASVQVHLTRGEAGSGSVAGGGAQAAGVELDPALVGRWVRRDSYVSGDFTLANERRVTLFPDGTYRFGPGRVIGGGDAGTFDSGTGGGGNGGRWRTQGQILYTMELGDMGWEPYARYYVEGNKVLLTFGNGSREIWHRE